MRSHCRHERRQGVIAALVAVAIVAVLMIAAIALDGGRVLDARRQAKVAADAAARGAAVEMLDMLSGTNTSATLSTVKASAMRIASDNGYTNDGVNSVVTVNSPPASGPYAGQSGYIEVIITANIDRGLSNLMGSGPISLQSRSVAGGSFVAGKGSLLILDPKKDKTLQLQDKTTSLTVAGDVTVNSKSKNSVSMDKGAILQADNVMVSGKMDKNQFKQIQKKITGQLHTQVPPTKDPYTGLPDPDPGLTQKLNDYKISGSGGSDTYNLQPGHYTEDWNFDHHDVVNLAPGTYYLDKHIDIHGQASIYGDGVLIYSADDGDFHFHTTGDIQLSPQTTGTYAGITMMKDASSKGNITFERDTNMDLSGSIYAPSAVLTFKRMGSSATVQLDGNFVVDSMIVQDHTSINITGSHINVTEPFLGLVE